MTSQQDHAQLFRSLHTPGSPLLLANAWDLGSARIIADAGARAVATTSAGVAWGQGTADGNNLSADDMVALVARIAAVVDMPLSADLESGYGKDPAGVAETVTRIVAAGAVGVNIEDTHSETVSPLRPTDEQAERIAAARVAADAAGVALFVNARVDTYFHGVGGEADLLGETLARARAYVDAGADGVFVPWVTDLAVVAALAEGIDVPLNILAGPGAPSVAEFAKAGAARISLGSSMASAAYGVAHRASRELFTSGTYAALAGGVGYAELNALMR
ncbi:isocitrate lyase/phosphoenolpyruvate mutase family protein [Streptacidiphilus sp. MAP12-33]|uniref:isocitrate lyase/PEP mutase family protein n=1 Tax=Streptacidiphilus sp. MAP12-33 TaxID=3156266 RepID=UPI003518D23F